MKRFFVIVSVAILAACSVPAASVSEVTVTNETSFIIAGSFGGGSFDLAPSESSTVEAMVSVNRGVETVFVELNGEDYIVSYKEAGGPYTTRVLSDDYGILFFIEVSGDLVGVGSAGNVN